MYNIWKERRWFDLYKHLSKLCCSFRALGKRASVAKFDWITVENMVYHRSLFIFPLQQCFLMDTMLFNGSFAMFSRSHLPIDSAFFLGHLHTMFPKSSPNQLWSSELIFSFASWVSAPPPAARGSSLPAMDKNATFKANWELDEDYPKKKKKNSWSYQFFVMTNYWGHQ